MNQKTNINEVNIANKINKNVYANQDNGVQSLISYNIINNIMQINCD